MAKKSGAEELRREAHKPSQAAPSVFFTGIDELYSLEGAARKKGRHVKSEDLTRIERAAMVVARGKIVWIGPEKNCPQELLKSTEQINLAAATVIPALVESHTHLIYSGDRAGEFERRNRGESYQMIAESGGGILSTVRETRLADETELVRLGQARLDRFIRQGVATVEVKSGYGLEPAAEMKMLRAAGSLSGARIVKTFLGAHALPKEMPIARDYLQMLFSEVLPVVRRENLATRVDIFVETGYFAPDASRDYLTAARALGFDLVIHADQLTRSGGAELAVELAARSAEHLICINESDIVKLAASEVTCGLLPNADLYMNCRYPPARQLIDAGARVALATDFNPGTSPSTDVALVGLLARLQMKMTLAEVLGAYTVGAAHALGLEREIGSLEIGKSADFAVLTGQLDELFYAAGRMPIMHLYQAGKCLH